ncbi:MAG: SCO family protein [Gammaproteobacteria bacterium]|nr:SCO family protein [Gammaproteobacteria bacterium]
MPSRNILVLSSLVLVTAFVTVLIAFSGFKLFTNKQVPTELLAVLKVAPTPLQPFSLIDQNNKPFTLKQLLNKNTLLFFGYTTCPDICPTTLTTLNQIYKQLKGTASYTNLNIVFVSVDPQRDTTDKLQEYMKYFNKDFLGVTGSKDNIDPFIKQFNAAYIIEEKSSNENYQVSHTSSIFLVNPQANIIASFSPPHNSKIIVSQLGMISER